MYTHMPNQRAEGLKLIPVQMKQGFIDIIDENLVDLGYSDRAKFIRDAIKEKLRSQGILIPNDLPLAPDRRGKGGQPTHKNYHLNDTPSAEAATRTAKPVEYGKKKKLTDLQKAVKKAADKIPD